MQLGLLPVVLVKESYLCQYHLDFGRCALEGYLIRQGNMLVF